MCPQATMYSASPARRLIVPLQKTRADVRGWSNASSGIYV
jgi:hypothetical protein